MTQAIAPDGRPRDDFLPNNSGLPALVAQSNSAGTGTTYTGLTAAQTLFTFTSDAPTSAPPQRRQRYRISVTIDITTLGSGAIQLQITYTDDSATGRTRILTLIPESGVDAVTANAAGPWSGSVDILTNPNTAVTVATIGTFTGCTYNLQGTCEELTRI